MKAWVLRRYGSPDVLDLTDLDRPAPGPGEVLVQVKAASVQPWDWHLMRGEPLMARLVGPLGLRRPHLSVLGADVSGVVVAAGEGVTEFAPGDEVWSMPEGGGFAEYVTISADKVARKPHHLSFAEAAAVPLAAMTALLAIRDHAKVRPGHRMLVNGASGGVGTFAVQLAKAYGAHVTAVCGGRNADLMRTLGADEVIDYAKEDFTRGGRPYDSLLFIAGNRKFRECRRVLRPKGVCVLIGGSPGRWVQPMGQLIGTIAASALVSQRAVVANVVGCPDIRRNLDELAGLMEDGKVRPVIDSTYAFDELRPAMRYQEEGHATGKVVLTM
ncbi:NAD(P)-dependent alcohol dehydrogenase [Nonomuraea sp. NPDC049504]|uniref:NAD(P)-dependent alcohol dehydrogenase n=1 Tax=Nonomuraea sp. NPDC049504 TaxID=3154729 RepID=UPI00342B84C6